MNSKNVLFKFEIFADENLVHFFESQMLNLYEDVSLELLFMKTQYTKTVDVIIIADLDDALEAIKNHSRFVDSPRVKIPFYGRTNLRLNVSEKTAVCFRGEDSFFPIVGEKIATDFVATTWPDFKCDFSWLPETQVNSTFLRGKERCCLCVPKEVNRFF